ncbi:MAG TPA: hypothetical protein PKH09_13445, partial [Parvularculaceae bacterium]|nr:hypothetical protein [Parvularculaceae bacterium]
MKRTVLCSAAVIALGADAFAADPEGFDIAYQSIAAADLARHIETLASDEFEGRAPGTAGEKK